MNQYRFWWDEINIEHIANHGVEPYEAEEVIDDDPFLSKVANMSLTGRLMPDAICWSCLHQSQSNGFE